ncbi:MAG: oxygen-independent coproporphyrinogen III oxidase [bacterium]|nr:oxygen-independent coproporphyrinogen III oxidase [bacterium]
MSEAGTPDGGLDFETLEAVLPRFTGAGPRYTSYPTVPVWKPSFPESDHARALSSCGRTGEVSLYAHIPFCRSLCHFCACNRVITRDSDLPERYLSAIGQEIQTTRSSVEGTPQCIQLHWGGGTPTHLKAGQIERLFRSMTDSFPLAPDAEVSIEVDPRVTDEDHVRALAECGFNRISLGVQDTNPDTQAAIHRIQPFELTRALTEMARNAGIPHINYDLVYGLPHQTEASFSRTITEVLSAEPDRIALYGYAHVTWVAKQQRGFERIDLPDPRLRIRILLQAIRQLVGAGYRFIGLDHFAKPDDELCEAFDSGTLRRNFMGYTTLDGVDTIAFGPSGISELPGAYVQAQKNLSDWFDRVEGGRLAPDRGIWLSRDDEMRRWIIRQIMCRGRLRASEVESRFGGSYQVDFEQAIDGLREIEKEGVLVLSPEGDLEVTSLGRLFLRNVAMAFDAYLEPAAEGGARVFSQTV